MRVKQAVVNTTDVPHLSCVASPKELHAHYKVFGGEVSQSPCEYIVRMPQRKRIHFYRYDHSSPVIYEKPFYFTSEGYYDEQSHLWRPPCDHSAVVASAGASKVSHRDRTAGAAATRR